MMATFPIISYADVAARELLRIDDHGVTLADDLTLDEARELLETWLPPVAPAHMTLEQIKATLVARLTPGCTHG